MRLNRPEKIIYDFCIIGTGPAGIILALELSKIQPEKAILLVEYGPKNNEVKNSLDDSIVNLNTQNHHSPYECTNKGLGGSSATWGGRCVMYDAIDFEEREIIGKDCTWKPELFIELQKYISKAAEYFECGSAEFNLNQIEKFKDKRIAEGFVEGVVTDSAIERWSMPTRFGERYEDEIVSSTNIFLVEGFEMRTFSSPDSFGNIETIILRNVLNNEEIKVNTKNIILAAGTQETTRILLKNLQVFKNLDKVPSSLGHFYQGHLSGKIASIRFNGEPRKTDYGFLIDNDQIYLRRRFQFTKEILIEKNLLNTAIWLDNPLYFNPNHKSGPMSFMYLAMITPIIGKKLAPPAIAQSITKGKVVAIHKHILNILKDLPGSIITPATIFYKRYLLKRKLPGVFLYSPENIYALHFHSEQLPSFKNEMRLGEDGETLIIDYNLTEKDIYSVIETHKILDNWLKKCGCGELQYWYQEIDLVNAIKEMSKDGIHQSGTTRIANTSEKGVVDNDLKIFGTNNVFICSSSVFPTSGQANPTFFLGAFAVRLAHHLKKINEKS